MRQKRLIIICIIAAVVIFLPGFSKYQELKSHNKALIEKINQVKNENKNLSAEVQKLKNDSFYIEKKARDKMGLGEKGEIRYKVIYETKKQ